MITIFVISKMDALLIAIMNRDRGTRGKLNIHLINEYFIVSENCTISFGIHEKVQIQRPVQILLAIVILNKETYFYNY